MATVTHSLNVSEKVENDQADACPRRSGRRAVYIGKSGCFRTGQCPEARYGREFEHCVELFAAGHRTQEKTPQAESEKRHERYAGFAIGVQEVLH